MRSTLLRPLALLAVLASLSSLGCATAGLPSGITSNPLVSVLTSGLGGGSLNSLADVQGAFSKLGMSPDTVSKFAPVIGDAISKGGGSQVASLFTGLFK